MAEEQNRATESWSDPGGAVAALVAAAMARGATELASLSREELSALDAVSGAALGPPLADSEEASWWAEMDEDERASVRLSGWESLGRRGLLRRVPGAEPDREGLVESVLAPELGILVVSRTHPAVVLAATAPTVDGRPAAESRYLFFAVTDERQGLRWVLAESIEPSGAHRFVLATAEWAAERLGVWACAPSERSERVIEAIRPSAEGPERTGMLVRSTQGDATVAAWAWGREQGLPAPVDAAEIAVRVGFLLKSV